jgi:hypothetical protein
MGVFAKGPGQDELKLAACYPDADLPNMAARIDRLQENCGWEIKKADAVTDVPAPTEKEMALLRALGPASLA